MNKVQNIQPKPYPPFFIVGCPRSGSTLLRQILNCHSRLSVYYESQYYTFFYSNFSYYGDLNISKNLERFLNDLITLVRIQGIMEPPSLDGLPTITDDDALYENPRAWFSGSNH